MLNVLKIILNQLVFVVIVVMATLITVRISQEKMGRIHAMAHKNSRQ